MGAALPIVGIGLGMIGSGVQAKSQYDQGVAADEAARTNARRMRAQAADVKAIANTEAGKVRTEATKIIGEQNVAFSASGVDASVGSPAALAAYSRAQAELDAQKMKNNAAREAWGINAQATETVRMGRAAKKAGKYAAIGTILGGAANAAGGIYGMKGRG